MAKIKRKSIHSKNSTLEVLKNFKSLKYLPRFFSELYRVSPLTFTANLAARLIGSLFPITMLWVGKLIIDEIILLREESNSDYQQLIMWVCLEFALAILSEITNRLISISDGLLGDLYSNKSSEKIILKTKEISMSQLEDPDFYDKMERARMGTFSRVNLISDSLGQVQSLISIISLTAGLIYFEPWLIVLLFLSIIPTFFNEIKFSGQRYSLARSWTAERRELDYLRYIGANDRTAKEVKLFGLSDFIADRFAKLAHKYFLLNKKLTIKRSVLSTIFNVIGTITYYAAYGLIIFRTITKVLSVGELTFLSGSFQRLRRNMQDFFSRITRITESSLYLKDYFDFMDWQNMEIQGSKPIPTKIQKGFRIKNVSFKYPGSKEYSIYNISFEIKAGEKIALVGENGAGKTTLIKLLLRFYKPTSGVIYLEDTPIEEFDIHAYQKMFGVIFQDFFRYEFTLGENIAVGNIDEIENEPLIQSAADQSLAADVVAEMQEGFSQQLGKRFKQGKDLSGGQWQKVALARAYMKDAKVLILDEPTSALDAKAEYEVFERFMKLTKNKTSIIISHRFSTVRMADRIIVLKAGNIQEEGKHEILLQNNNLYAELFKLQASGYR